MKHATLALLGLALTLVAVPLARASQEPASPSPPPSPHDVPRWEYEVVGLVELHGTTLDYLKEALEGEGLLGKARKADEQLARKTEDLLDELGAEGWELVHVDSSSMILKRPAR